MFIYILLTLILLSLGVFALPSRWKQSYILVLIFLVAAVSIFTGAKVLAGGEQAVYRVGSDIVFGWTMLVIDKLSALFMIMISVGGVSVGVYSRGYLKGYIKERSSAHISIHLMSLVIMFVSMIFVVIAHDAFSFLFSWELMTISSFLLILFDADQNRVRKAALNYLVLMHVGFIFLVVGFVTIASKGYPATFDSLAGYFGDTNPVPLFLMFLIGFGLKAGIFPLHIWLPEAHPAAPSHVSAFMSGIMIKMGVYGVMRVISYVQSDLYTIGVIVLCIGLVTGLWGAILAAVQNDIKRLLAYSSIENIGIIFIAIGAAAIGRAMGNNFFALCAMSGALLHTLNHSLFKMVLFFGAGNIYTQAKTTSLNALGGLSKRMPITAILFLVGTIAITALPPLNGFISEYMIYYSFIEAIAADSGGVIPAICGIVAIAIIGGIIMLAFTKLYGVAFLGTPRSEAVDKATEVGRSRIVGIAIPVAGIILIGVMPYFFVSEMFSIAGSFMKIKYAETYYSQLNPQIYNIASAIMILVVVVGALLLYRRYQLRRRVVGSSPVWGCGFTAPTSKMQYTGESYAEGLYAISSSISSKTGVGDVVDKSEIFPSKRAFDIKHSDKISSLFSEWWTKLIHKVNIRVMRLNTGKVNHYILYALMFLVLILLLSILKII